MDPSPIPVTRPTLLARLRLGDSSAWEEFVEVYGTHILRWCKRHLQEADAEDASHDVLVKLYKAIKTFEYDPQRGKFRGWLKKVTDSVWKDLVASHDNALGKKAKFEPDCDVSNKAVNPKRNGQQEENPPRKDSDGRLVVDGRLDDKAEQEFRNSVQKASRFALLGEAEDRVRSQVKSEYWQVYLLRKEGLTSKEVAEKLTITPSQVNVAYSRVLARLRVEIKKNENGDARDGPSAE
jgi:RNA polymerase sigma-70 factor (ECF subfamily)